MKTVNVIKVIANKKGGQVFPPLYFNGKDSLVKGIENAKHYRKLGSAVMENGRKKVLKAHPGIVIELVTENLEPTPEITEEKPTLYDEAVEMLDILDEAEDEEATEENDTGETAEIDEETEDEEDDKRMSKRLDQYRKGYHDSVSYSGKKSKVNGDEVSECLMGLTPEDVMAAAEEILELPTGELVAKYAHLNPGQRRMNAGNRIRAAVKREDVTIDDVKAVLH